MANTKDSHIECVNYFKDIIDISLDKFDNNFWRVEYDNVVWDFTCDP